MAKGVQIQGNISFGKSNHQSNMLTQSLCLCGENLKDNSGKNQWNCNERSKQSAFWSVQATRKSQPKKKEVISEEGYKLCSHANDMRISVCNAKNGPPSLSVSRSSADVKAIGILCKFL
jgi:hypothetical protein